MFNLMLITNDHELAQYAVSSGVNRIFVDLEINGKYERQGHLDTLISKHSMEDVYKIRKAIPSNELLVRLNPLYDDSYLEVEEALKAGADIIMLPMFKTAEDISEYSKIIDGRARFIPLVETSSAAECLEDVVNINGVDEIYIGLNDLHRDLGLSFMFEPLVNGLVEDMSVIIKKAKLPFGFGGIARIGDGTLPAELILAEHVRLGSSCVILSRTFHQRSESLTELENNISLQKEVNKILSLRKKLSKRDIYQQVLEQQQVKSIVKKIISGVI